MKLPVETLEILRCSHCTNFLSRGPIYLEHDGSSACSACRSKKRPAIRNTYYEEIAKFASFPCKYEELGCSEYVPFTGEKENKHHEEICEHREFVCPLLGSSKCEWLGNKNTILDHCETEHADKVVSNNFILTYDITKSCNNTYLLKAFQLLFLLYTKVCTTSGKLYHSVRYLGRSDEIDNFTFNLTIQRKDEVLVKKGSVAPQGCLAIQEPTSLAMDLNSLLSILGGWDGASFTITINQVIKQMNTCITCGLKQSTLEPAEENNWTCDHCNIITKASTSNNEQPIVSKNTCVKCGSMTSEIVYHDNDGIKCVQCSPTKIICKNEYCMFKDIDVKCRKHTNYFCKMRTFCYLCRHDLLGISLHSHYTFCNPYENKWLIKAESFVLVKSENIIFESIVGPAICCYNISHKHFIVEVYTSIATEELHKFQCVIKLLSRTNNKLEPLVLRPEIEYNNVYDWIVDIPFFAFKPFYSNCQLDVSITSINL